ncbi:MAG: adenylate kinase family protein [Candidatus Bathyarchaeota archaeon]|nr:adenylate kinase family protein [Candidatus Bathyarchaeota archaeon]
MKLIVITGTPGVGKTSISKILAEKLGAIHIDVNKLVLDEKLDIGYDKKRKCYIVDFEKVSKKLIEKIKITSEDNLILDGHYATSVIDPKKIDRVFVLRCNPVELEKRLRERDYPQEKVSENLMAELLDVCFYDSIKNCGEDKVRQIDVTEKSSDEVVSKIISILAGELIKTEQIDWISEFENKEKLEWFLNY